MTWIQIYTGRKFDLLNPSPEDVCIEDIAHALSMICRFNGHCNKFYSVAEHSLHVSYRAIRPWKLEGLLHDATEAYVGDMVKPLKCSEPMKAFREIEHDIRYAIATKFGLWLSVPPNVKYADLRMLATERDQLMGPEVEPWFEEEVEPFHFSIPCYAPRKAEQGFLQRFRELTEELAKQTWQKEGLTSRSKIGNDREREES